MEIQELFELQREDGKQVKFLCLIKKRPTNENKNRFLHIYFKTNYHLDYNSLVSRAKSVDGLTLYAGQFQPSLLVVSTLEVIEGPHAIVRKERCKRVNRSVFVTCNSGFGF